jgi:hypothetical protein
MTQQQITFTAFEARGSRLAQIKDHRSHSIGHIFDFCAICFCWRVAAFSKLTGVGTP